MQTILDNPNISIVEIKVHSPEWYEFRKNGVGTSEVGYLLSLSPYKSSLELYYEKVGIYEPPDWQSEPAFHGTNLEAYTVDMWQYHDGSDEGYMDNYANNNKIKTREYYEIKDKYFINKKYPWMFVSLDGLILPGNPNMITGEPLKTHGILEAKLISGFVLKQWDGVPPSYLAQIHQAMIVLECEYAELAMLQDGKRFSVQPLELSRDFADVIIEKSKDFWYNRVAPAKELMAKKKEADLAGDIDSSNELESQINQLEPPPDDSEAYKNFMAKSALGEPETIGGGLDELAWAESMKNLGSMGKKIASQKLLYENRLRKFMKDEKVDKVDFGEEGYVKLSERKNSDKLLLSNGIKYKPDADFIDKEYKKLNLISE